MLTGVASSGALDVPDFVGRVNTASSGVRSSQVTLSAVPMVFMLLMCRLYSVSPDNVVPPWLRYPLILTRFFPSGDVWNDIAMPFSGMLFPSIWRFPVWPDDTAFSIRIFLRLSTVPDMELSMASTFQLPITSAKSRDTLYLFLSMFMLNLFSNISDIVWVEGVFTDSSALGEVVCKACGVFTVCPVCNDDRKAGCAEICCGCVFCCAFWVVEPEDRIMLVVILLFDVCWLVPMVIGLPD